MKYNEIVHQFQHNVFGNLTTIRSFKDSSKIWFLGKEIQILLGHSNITQAVKAASLGDDETFLLLKDKNTDFWKKFATNLKLDTKTRNILFISESGLYKLILRSRKPEMKNFYNWVTRDVLPSLRQNVEDHLNFKHASVEISKHLDIEHQKFESKRINKINVNKGGMNTAVRYNRDSCLDHSGFTPKMLKTMAEKAGISASKRTSGKEVLRMIDMSVASSMSLTDSLVADCLPYNKALPISKTTGKELFRKLIEAGIMPKELDM